MVTWMSIPLGIVLLGLAVRDILLTVMTPTSRGAISGQLMALCWRGIQPVVRRWSRMREIAGPMIFVSVIAAWAAMIVVGWALIYWPFLPDDFLVDFGLDLDRDSPGNFLTATYFSMVVLSTLGFGDIVPTGMWLRMLVPLQGLIGFGLITAGISWFLSIFPTLSRRRRLAHQIALVREAEEDIVEQWESDATVTLLDSFSEQLIDVRSDQIQFPIIYYFRDADPAAELVPNLGYLLEMTDLSHRDEMNTGSSMHLHQHMLRRAVDDYLQTLAAQFLDLTSDDRDAIMEALEREQV
jgi:hypothetical protein